MDMDLTLDRREEWRRSECNIDTKKVTNQTAIIDVRQGDLVVVTYGVLAQLLSLLGYHRVDNITADGTPKQA